MQPVFLLGVYQRTFASNYLQEVYLCSPMISPLLKYHYCDHILKIASKKKQGLREIFIVEGNIMIQ